MYHDWMMSRYPMLEQDDGTQGGNDNPNPEDQPKAKTLDDILKENPEFQKEFDRRMSKGLETGKAKWAEEAKLKAEQERSEAERLAKLTAEQRAQEEWKKREDEYNSRIHEVTVRELKAEARETLSSKGLPVSLLDTLDFSSAEACNASIDAVGKAFREAVQQGVEDRLKGKLPSMGGKGGAGEKPDFSKMTDAEYYEYMRQQKAKK